MNEITDHFLYPWLGYAELLRDQGRLVVLTLDRTTLGRLDLEPFYELLIITMTKITGFSGAQLAFLPVGGLLIACTYFAISKRFFQSNIIAFILTLTLMCESSITQGMYNVYYHAWAFPIYLMSVLSFVNLVTKRRVRDLILLLLLFTSMQYIHPTTTLWIMALPPSFILASLFRRVQKYRLGSRRFSLVLFLCFLVIYLATSNGFYFHLEIMLIRGRIIGLQEMLRNVVDKITSSIFRSEDWSQAIQIQELASPEVARLQLAYHIITVVPIVLYFLVQLSKSIMRKRKSEVSRNNERNLLVWVGVVTSLLTILVYLQVAGYPGTKYNLFFFPIVATSAFSLLSKRSKHMVLIFVLVLLMVNASKLALASDYMLTRYSRYSSIQIGAEWLLKNGGQTSMILSDFRTSGAITLRWSTDGYVASNVRSITLRLYEYLRTSSLYSDPACSFLSNSSHTLLVVDEKALHEPFYADNWQFAPPLSSLLENKTFNRIYDGKIIIFDISNISSRQ